VSGARALGLAAVLAVSAAALAGASGAGQATAAGRGTTIGLDQAALLVIDIQNFYFEGGRAPLVGSVEASRKAKRVLEAFRKAGRPVIHVRHMPQQDPASSDPQYAIHHNVAPLPGETVLTKHYANAFRETDLAPRLEKLGVNTLVVCGMQTHMCVEAAVRYAADLGYKIVLVEDACATRDLAYGGTKVPAKQVQAAVLAALTGTYAEVVTADDIQ
jgi:nicotinamidase-related amidase